MTQQTLNIVPKYRYIIASVKDGTIRMEVPFSSVSWERKVNGAGSFSGTIAANPERDVFDIYDSTLPGKYAIYIFRDGVLVWGGIIWTRDYDVTTKVLNVSALEFTSYLFHRIFWKTLYFDDGTSVKALLEGLISNTTNDELGTPNPYSASDTHILPTYYAQSGFNVTLTTEEAHGFVIGNEVRISGTGLYDWDGVKTITAIDATNRTFTYVSSGSRTVTTTAFSVDGAQYAILETTYQTIQNSVDVNLSYDIDDALSTYQIVGTGDDNPFEFRGHKFHYVGEILNNFAQNGVPSVTYDASPSATYAKVVRNVSSSVAASFSASYASNTITINISSGVSNVQAGDYINVTGITYNGATGPVTGPFLLQTGSIGGSSLTYTAPTGTTSITVGTLVVTTTPVRISSKSLTSNVATLTTGQPHGLSVNNRILVSNVDATFDGGFYTVTAVTTNTFSYAKTAANVENTYVKSLYEAVRFDYHVVPSYNSTTKTFSNTFRAWKVKTDTNKPSGTTGDGNALSTLTGPSTVYGDSSLGANYFIFEHPGNIVSLTLTENAESSASRTWVVDSGTDLDANAAPPYGSYTNLPYLNAGFPMLDIAITDRNLPVAIDEEVIPYAKQIGYRLAPPIGEYKITVNGSLQPEVNTYQPGDWCTIIPNDAFINNRLTIPYENRSGVLVRKIKSFKVNVPDNPSFPETVDLEVVPEWEIS